MIVEALTPMGGDLGTEGPLVLLDGRPPEEQEPSCIPSTNPSGRTWRCHVDAPPALIEVRSAGAQALYELTISLHEEECSIETEVCQE